jgi:hypothetical protein
MPPRLFQDSYFIAVTALELGELGGEGADHAAWLVRVCRGGGLSHGFLLLGSELFYPMADLGSAVEEVR